MSALLTSVSFFSLRMRPGALVPIKWRLPECPRLILPFAVNLKRFLAPRWVFNFNFGFDAFLGIAGNPLDNLLRRLLRRGGGEPPPPKYFFFLLSFLQRTKEYYSSLLPSCLPLRGAVRAYLSSRRR